MYIKQIILQGFKSYKEQTVIEPFSSRHNVIVGRNGSGKSNFFWAIRFVLGDAYTSLTREERQSLLHEGHGPSTVSAYVEIIFDNAQNRFPTGRDEVVLRRTVGLKKDEYALDRKSVPRTEVLNLLESAGFSRCNPYYIVPQGRITMLMNAKDRERLQLLKEVAGTSVYEQRRTESIRIMEDTQAKRAKIDEMLTFIEERLSELEEEKNELKQYQELDRERRCLEYTIFSREQSDALEKLDQLEEERRAQVDDVNHAQSQISAQERQIALFQQELDALREQLKCTEVDQSSRSEERKELERQQVDLEMQLEDLLHRVTKADADLSEHLAMRQELEQQRQQAETFLAEGNAQFTRLQEAEKRQSQEVLALKVHRDHGVAQLQRLIECRSAEERDTRLDQQIKNLDAQKADLKALLDTTGERLQTFHKRQYANDENRENSGLHAQQVAKDLDANQRRIEETRQRRSEVEDERKRIWRDEAQAHARRELIETQLSAKERQMFKVIDKNTFTALDALPGLVKRLNLPNPDNAVFGPLAYLFTVDPRYATAVETIASSSLFHVVVRDDDVAAKLMKALAREKLGRLTFMPLNRLVTPSNLADQVIPESATDAIPIMRKLTFEPVLLPAFQQVFGKALVCPDLDTASQYARAKGLVAVTLGGDRADRRGGLMGGYHDAQNSRMEIVQAVHHLRKRLAEEVAAQDAAQLSLHRLEQQILAIRDELERLDDERQQLRIKKQNPTGSGAAGAASTAPVDDSAALRSVVENLQATFNEIESDMSVVMQMREYLAEERTRPFESGPKAVEVMTENVRTTEENLRRSQAELDNTIGMRQKLEGERKLAQLNIEQHLSRRLEQLDTQIAAMRDIKARAGEKKTLQQRIASIKKHIAKLVSQIDAGATQLDQLETQVLERTREMEALRAEMVDTTRRLDAQQRTLTKYMSRRNLLQERKDETVKNIRDLGVLPEEAFSRYVEIPNNLLHSKLTGVMDQLAKYSHVNNKAFEQFGIFTRQKEALNQRKREMANGASAIQDLITSLDHRKDEAMERTFKQVALNFSAIWQQLVPAGTGSLVMLRHNARGGSQPPTPPLDDDDDDVSPQAVAGKGPQQDTSSTHPEQYVGIAIQVSFVPDGEDLRMQQLSGGQKALVALALIFAIQRCDPAPFYLFDEIDAALDPQYRAAVASMIHELSQNAQFITTTFRPELLVRANRFYGVTFHHKVSQIACITREMAQQFIEEDQPNLEV